MSGVSGWTPLEEEDQVELFHPQPLSSDIPSALITSFQLQSSMQTDIVTRPSSPEAPSPASSNYSLSGSFSFSLDPSAETGDHEDPSFVARPRNAFIIFRCEFARLHTRQGKRVRRRAGTTSEKVTLSKRAGEAWRALSEDQRRHWQALADREKVEHARLHPSYRFRPAKKNLGHKKKAASLSRSKSYPSISPPTTPLVVLAPFPRHPLPLAISLSPPPPVAADKASRRRSASVPTLPLVGNFSSFEEWAPQFRSRSVMGNRSLLTSIDVPQSFDHLYDDCTPTSYLTEDLFGNVFSIGSLESAAPSGPLIAASDPIQTSPSLAFGNDEIQHPSESVSPWSSSPFGGDLALPHGSQGYMEYSATSYDPSLAEGMPSYLEDHRWASAPGADYSHATLGLESDGMLFSPVTLYNDATASCSCLASQEYLDAAAKSVEEAMLSNYLQAQYSQYSP
ncbi:hypothetical protein C0991_009825 [Blastosporella zonata]|nr:hypothetical protein C0991_009825 [Blastosporella zonata]